MPNGEARVPYAVRGAPALRNGERCCVEMEMDFALRLAHEINLFLATPMFSKQGWQYKALRSGFLTTA